MQIRLPRLLSNSVVSLTRFNSKSKHRTFSSNEISSKNFTDIIHTRQAQAKRTIVVQVASENSFKDVHQYCSQFGHISNAYFYTVPKDTSFILLEYDNEDAVTEAFQVSAFPDLSSGVVPVQSSFLWFRNTPNKRQMKAIKQPKSIQLSTSESIYASATKDLVNVLSGAASVSDQILKLYENTRLNDLSIRLRFLGALQIQRALSGLFLNHTVLPFGSTVNGFGKLGCDLDLILHYNCDDKSFNPSNNEYGSRRLMFHTKGCSTDTDSMKRGVTENHIKFYGALCESFIPGATNVLPIYKARVPIVRYLHKYLDLSVDISLLNMTGFHISELFHIFGELDERVRPLVFVVRRWAQEIQLSSKTRTNTITNFQLTCLVLSFLQQLPKPILPTVPELVAKARKSDVRLSDDNRSYTFLRDISSIEFQTENTSSLDELLIQFFEFYGSFDFTKYVISLTSKQPIRKIEPTALQIANPFEMEQNWSRNVASDECMALKMHAQNSFAELMDMNSTTTKTMTPSSSERWGLLTIFPNLK